jgi:P-type conjugative transfer protein TrbJ
LAAASGALAMVLAVLESASPASAQLATVCTNCSTLVTQLQEEANSAQALINQATQLQHEVTSLQNQATNLLNFPNQLWTTVQSDLNKVQNLFSAGSAVSFMSGNISAQFAAKYPGLQSYQTTGVTPQLLASKQLQWDSDTLSLTQNSLSSLQLQNNDFATEQQVLAGLQSQSSSSQGALQALQVSDQMLGELIAQMQKLRQLMMIQVQMEVQAQAQASDQLAVYQTWRSTFNAPYSATYGNQTFGTGASFP